MNFCKKYHAQLVSDCRSVLAWFCGIGLLITLAAKNPKCDRNATTLSTVFWNPPQFSNFDQNELLCAREKIFLCNFVRGLNQWVLRSRVLPVISSEARLVAGIFCCKLGFAGGVRTSQDFVVAEQCFATFWCNKTSDSECKLKLFNFIQSISINFSLRWVHFAMSL